MLQNVTYTKKKKRYEITTEQLSYRTVIARSNGKFSAVKYFEEKNVECIKKEEKRAAPMNN